MIAILPLIMLVVRFSNFSKLTLGELPLIGEGELQDMKRYSKIARDVFIVFTVLSFVPYAVLGVGVSAANYWSLGVTVVGLISAATFDLKAERIKKRGKPAQAQAQKEDQVRWYHILAGLVFSIGLPWGIVNLCRRRRKSGLTMVIIGCVMFLLGTIPFILKSK